MAIIQLLMLQKEIMPLNKLSLNLYFV